MTNPISTLSEPLFYATPYAQRLLAVTSFLLGACVGSFLNVVIYRLPLSISLTNPKRSFCPACRYQIPGWLNIPIFSWLTLGGKCKNCAAPISPRYFFVEVLTALLFLFIYMWFRDRVWLCLPMWTFSALALSATYIDLDHTIIPRRISYSGVGAALIMSTFIPDFIIPHGSWRENLLHSFGGAAAGAGVIWLVVQFGKLAFGRLNRRFPAPVAWSMGQPSPEEDIQLDLNGEIHHGEDIFSRKTDQLKITCESLKINDEEQAGSGQLAVSMDTVTWAPTGSAEPISRPLETVLRLTGTTTHVTIPREAMGLGDVHFMAMIGAFTGWKGVLFTLMAASLLGAVISVTAIACGRRDWTARIPFGPYLAAGGMIWALAGPIIVQAYFEWVTLR
jgi:leader peptidase (prepilin peptidase) / N-methyltransferase